MNSESLERWELQVHETARSFPYPPTPNIAKAVTQRLGQRPAPSVRRQRVAWALAILVVALAGLLAVPPVRAAIVEFFQVGAIRIFPAGQPPTPTAPLLTPTDISSPQAGTASTPTAAAEPTATLIPSLLKLAGRTTLEEARTQADFPIRLPAYPQDLGEPDYVFRQDMGDDLVVLVWTEPDDPDRVRLSLHAFGQESWAGEKGQVRLIQETRVNGNWAIWTQGPYILQLTNGDMELRRMVMGNVLLWVEDGINYRLEANLPLEEAVRIAESLR